MIRPTALAALGIAICLGACAPAVSSNPTTSAPTVVAAATSTVTPSPEPSLTPTATETALPPTATRTPRPTRTTPPTATETPRATFTPAPTLPPPPTATATAPPLPPAPVFPSTTIKPWSVEDFRVQVYEGRLNVERFVVWARDIWIGSGQPGSCSFVLPAYEELTVKRAGYGSDVPGEWGQMYYEYRVLIHEAAGLWAPFADACRGTGQISESLARTNIALLEGTYLRLVDLEARTNAGP